MSDLIIEQGIPIPPAPVGRKSKYPLAPLEVGDSFFVARKKLSKIAPYFTQVAKRTGRKYALRSIDGGVRVWRVK